MPLEEEVQFSNFAKNTKEAKYCQGANSRLYGNLTQIYTNLKSTETGNKYGKACKVCGKLAYSKYYIFGVYLHLISNRGQ